MLLYYIKIALRNFKTNRVIFAGNLLTLCLSTLCISLLFSYVRNELTIDNFHKNKQNIYMTVIQATPEAQKRGVHTTYNVREQENSSTIIELDALNTKNYPKIVTKVSVKTLFNDQLRFEYNNTNFLPKGLLVDSTFFKVFDFKLKLGNKKTVLQDHNNIVLTERYAKKMFGLQNPIGKTIMLTEYGTLVTVKGMVETPQANSSLDFDYLIPRNIENKNRLARGAADFILTTEGFDKDSFKKNIEKMMKVNPMIYSNSITSIVSLGDLYFNEEGVNTNVLFTRSGSKKNVYVLIVIISVILLITVLNLANLQVIATNISIKAMALNLIHGASKRHLGFQKTTEAILLLLGATIIVVTLYKMILPTFNNFTNIALAPSNSVIVLTCVSILVLLILLSMIYPVFIAQKNTVVSGLKKHVSGARLVGNKFMITIQYGLTFILLISSFVVIKQLQLMLDKDLGFETENSISTQLILRPSFNPKSSKKEGNELFVKMKESDQFIKNELASNSSVAAFSKGSIPINTTQYDWKRKDGNYEFTSQHCLRVLPAHKDIYEFELVEGRFYDDVKDADDPYGIKKVVINEVAKKYWNIKDISKARLSSISNRDVEIIGVVKDFNFEHLSAKPQPLIMTNYRNFNFNFLIRFREGATASGLRFVEELFNKVNPGATFKYSFLSDNIAALYQKEKRLSTIYIVFTIIALLISAIGLFTIALYDTRRRIKEIGVHKVNGATIGEILYMLNKDFIKWVLVAFVVACPIAYFLMSNWLENFAYKTALNWWLFALSGGFTIIIALLAVSWQSYGAATVNPVDALRDE